MLTDGSIEQPEVTDDDKVRALPRTTFRAECHIWASLRGLSHDHLKHPECKLFCKKKVLQFLRPSSVPLSFVVGQDCQRRITDKLQDGSFGQHSVTCFVRCVAVP